MRINQEYSTTDLGLASFLSLYFTLDALDKTFPEKTSFIFIRSVELEKLVDAYWKRKVQVNPQDYFSAIKNLKSRLYANK